MRLSHFGVFYVTSALRRPDYFHAMAVPPKLVWLVGCCAKQGKPDVTDLCEAGFVPVLHTSVEEAIAEINPHMRVSAVIVLPGCQGNVKRLTNAVTKAWPGVNICIAACQSENCRAPGQLACAVACAGRC